MSFENYQRRVVITGLGVIAPTGHDLQTFWKSVFGGLSGAAEITRFDTSSLPVKIAAEVKDFDLKDYVPGSKAGRFDRNVQYGLAAALLAVQDAHIDLERLDSDRLGVVEGTTVSGAESVLAAYDSFLSSSRDYLSLHPYNIVAGYCGEGSSAISFHLGIRGPAVTYCSGCASGNDAIGYAAQMIRGDETDLMIAGGTEEIVEMLHIGFCKLKAMARNQGNPEASMRPFDLTRDGFLLGEGAAFLVLEELSHALERGARIYAEVIGHGRTCEAYHPTDPHPDGVGYHRAMEKALLRARIHPSEVDYVNAHGSATPRNDPVETAAIKRIFREHATRLAISATKPVTGHLMGASGAIETLICALALWHEAIPPTINLTEPDPTCDLDYVPLKGRSYPLRLAMNLNAGFGGRYGCLILKKYCPAE